MAYKDFWIDEFDGGKRAITPESLEQFGAHVLGQAPGVAAGTAAGIDVDPSVHGQDNVQAVLEDHEERLGSAQSGSGSGAVAHTTVAASGSTEALSAPETGEKSYDITLTADCTFTLSGGSAGQAATLRLILRQDGTGSREVTWPGSVQWPSGAAPALSATAGHYDVVTLYTTDAGTTWTGLLAAAGFEPPSQPVNTLTPAITGTAVTTNVLSCSHGTWAGSPTSYTYQWKRNGSAISGETANTHTLDEADEDQSIKCTVTALNSAGSASEDSNTVTPSAPDDIADMPGILWLLDGDDLIGSDSAAAVTWADTSGNSRDFGQATSGFRPIKKTDGPNGHSYARFDGSDDRMRPAAFSPSGVTGLTYCIVYRLQSDGSYPAVMEWDAQHFELRHQDNTRIPSMTGTATNVQAATGALTLNTWHMVRGVYDGSSQVGISVDSAAGSVAAASGALPVTSIAPTLGARSDGTIPAQVDVAYVIAFGRVLTSDEIISLESALRARFSTP